MIDEILKFWFGDLKAEDVVGSNRMQLWFQKNPQTDEEIQNRFGNEVKEAASQNREDWKSTPRGTLAWIILLDQFSRNIYRNSPQSWKNDPQVLETCLSGLQKGFDKELTPIERVFFYLPLEHSEDKGVQAFSVKQFQNLARSISEKQKKQFENFLDYAIRHKEIIDRFGRFPHRNEILNRPSTSEEIEFLKQPGSSF